MIDYTDTPLVIFKFRGSVLPYATLAALPACLISIALAASDTLFPGIRDDLGLNVVPQHASVLWNSMTGVLVILLALRLRQALGRFWEGTSLLHQMRGEWFDAASCLVTFSRDAKINKGMIDQVNEFRSTLVRLMSLMHGSALDGISGNQDSFYTVIDLHGLDAETLMFLKDCHDKGIFCQVEALQHLIQVLVTQNHLTGVLAIPAPILSRVYQTLSRGFVNLLNARKIHDTMFPMPFVQIIQLLLVMHSFFSAFMMAVLVDSKAWAVIFTFFPIFGMYCVNRVCWELEMPFGSDFNDLPLMQFQDEMNDTLLMLVDKGCDHMPKSSPNATDQFTEIVAGRRNSASFFNEKSTEIRSSGAITRRSLFTFSAGRGCQESEDKEGSLAKEPDCSKEVKDDLGMTRVSSIKTDSHTSLDSKLSQNSPLRDGKQSTGSGSPNRNRRGSVFAQMHQVAQTNEAESKEFEPQNFKQFAPPKFTEADAIVVAQVPDRGRSETATTAVIDASDIRSLSTIACKLTALETLHCNTLQRVEHQVSVLYRCIEKSNPPHYDGSTPRSSRRNKGEALGASTPRPLRIGMEALTTPRQPGPQPGPSFP